MRRMIWRGRKIRASDKNLVLYVVLGILLACFSTGVLLVCREQVLDGSGSWHNITGRQIMLGVLFGGMLAVLLFAVAAKQKKVKENIVNRQRLARMLLENNWYEWENRDGRKRITYFPKIRYRRKKNRIFVMVQISMGKYQEHLLSLEEKIETGLDCELVEKETRGAVCYYEFLTDVEHERIQIDDVRAEHGELLLMNHISWNYDKVPHGLISGGTGSGKTFFLLSLIEAFIAAGAKLYIVDPKNADLAGLGEMLPDVYFKKEDIVMCLSNFRDAMLARTKKMKARSDYAPGKNYAAYGYVAQFLIFDEYVAFMDMLDKKEVESVMSLMKQIIMLGRQVGFFIVLACQRPDAKYLGEGLRDQFGLRVALGNMSDTGYSMMFGSTDKLFVTKQIDGRGYINVGGSVVTEFYAPFVSKSHDFFTEIPKKYTVNVPVDALAGEAEAERGSGHSRQADAQASATPGM